MSSDWCVCVGEVDSKYLGDDGGGLAARGEAQTRKSEARRHLAVDFSKKSW